MRIYSNPYELMSETARNLYEMGTEVKPKTYQNKVIEGKDEFITKELICEQYCLTHMDDPSPLFVFTKSKDWADAEFKERVSNEWVNPGTAWELRKDVWEQFLVDGIFDYTYNIRMTPLNDLIRLLKKDSDTRKAVLPIFNGVGQVDTNYYDGERRIPCSMYYDFLIRENARGEKQLNICYHQRSSDFVTHFGNDVYLAWRLMEYVASEVGIKPGYLYHTIDSLHSYKKDWVKLKTSIQTELR
jgi:thymidylate synthase